MSDTEIAGVLSGIRIVELAGLGPGPFCGMLLADLGADVIVVERPTAKTEPRPWDIVNRGKRSVVLDLKKATDVQLALKLIESADGLIEGMRPGVMERLGLGPQVCLARNPKLAYGRITGWGQTGPLAQAAGHDTNYVGVSGAAWYGGALGSVPVPPPTLVGDLGGGAMYLAVGLLAAITHVRMGGRGQVIDAAIVDGSAHLMTLLHSLIARGELSATRGDSWIDGSPWYRPYACRDGELITVGALEPKFFAELMSSLGIAAEFPPSTQFDKTRWPAMQARMSNTFSSRTRVEWCALLEGSDACFGPLLEPAEAASHPHNVTRGVFTRVDGVSQASPAPRFSNHPQIAVHGVPAPGQHTAEILRDLLAEPIGAPPPPQLGG